ncbi:MAG TPA: histidine kinase [Steroidobacteraceae bacterium]|nr:histidine kinase [Steroidobacteraceae bacterium]
MTPTARKLIGIWLAWTAAGVFFATQDFLTRLYRSESVPWLSVFAGWMAAMYICAAFTPIILWLGRRWALERGHIIRRVLLHLLFSAVFSLISNVLEAPIVLTLKVIPGSATMSLQTAMSLLLVYGFHGGMMRYWAVLGIQAIFRAHEKTKEREREAMELTVRSAKLAQQVSAAQLGALKMQLQPHFLFNTLGAIMVLTEQNKRPEAVQTLARLSDLLRLTLDDVDAHEVTLQRELDFLRLYLSIEQMRFQDRLLVEITAAPNTSDALVPHMVLQPIVENAIQHGLARSEDAVLIEIRAEKKENALVLTVTDDGPGCDTSFFDGDGIGLPNTRDRLKHLYGANGIIRAANREPEGVHVTVTLPFHTEPMEVADAIEDLSR